MDPIWVERNDFLPPPAEFRNDVRLHRGAYPRRSDGRAGVSLREHVGAGLAGGDRELEGVELTVVSVSRCPGEALLGGREGENAAASWCYRKLGPAVYWARQFTFGPLFPCQ